MPFEDRRAPGRRPAPGLQDPGRPPGRGERPEGRAAAGRARRRPRHRERARRDDGRHGRARPRRDGRRGAPASPAVISGLANEFLQYFVTPEEYDRQHYEGGSQLYGRLAANLVKVRSPTSPGGWSAASPRPTPYAADPRNGVRADAAPFGRGADRGRARPRRTAPTVRHLERARFAWQGGPRGLDRPLDRAFVTRRARACAGAGAGSPTTSACRSSGASTTTAATPPSGRSRSTRRAARYRFRVTANRYELRAGRSTSSRRTTSAAVVADGRVRPALPAADAEDLTWRPEFARRLVGRRSASGASGCARRSGFGSVAIPPRRDADRRRRRPRRLRQHGGRRDACPRSSGR